MEVGEPATVSINGIEVRGTCWVSRYDKRSGWVFTVFLSSEDEQPPILEELAWEPAVNSRAEFTNMEELVGFRFPYDGEYATLVISRAVEFKIMGTKGTRNSGVAGDGFSDNRTSGR